MHSKDARHRRLLVLVIAEYWRGIYTDDEQSLRMLIFTGHMEFIFSPAHQGRRRLVVTPSGYRYLRYLQGRPPPHALFIQ